MRCTVRTPGTRRRPRTIRFRWRRSSASTTNSTMASPSGDCFVFDTADIGVVVGDNGGQLLEHAGAIVAEDGDLDRIALGAAGILFAYARPLDRDAAVALVEQVLHVGTTARMDRDALAARHVADDFFAANRIATSRAIDQQIVLAFHLE